MKSSGLVALGSILAFLVGCFRSHQAWYSSDSWYHVPSESSRFREERRLPDADIIEVRSEYKIAAEALLRDVACIEISAERASEFIGRPLSERTGSKLFLVRAVYLNSHTGGFMVVPRGDELLVEHSCLGRSAVPMKRQALVVRLPQKPHTVFVSCSMAE